MKIFGEIRKATVFIFSIIIIFSFSPNFIAARSPQDQIFTGYSVKVIYFYPADFRPDKRYLKAADPLVEDVRLWFRDIVGATFTTQPVIAIKGKLKAADYGPPDRVWINVYAELGIECGTNTVTLIFLARTLQHANGRSCGPWYAASDNGDVTLSDELFDAELLALKKGFCPNGYPLGDWRCSPAASRGAVAHELGHAFSLFHPQGCESYGYEYCRRTVMWFWWTWPHVGLIDESFAPEISTLRRSPWFY